MPSWYVSRWHYNNLKLFSDIELGRNALSPIPLPRWYNYVNNVFQEVSSKSGQGRLGLLYVNIFYIIIHGLWYCVICIYFCCDAETWWCPLLQPNHCIACILSRLIKRILYCIVLYCTSSLLSVFTDGQKDVTDWSSASWLYHWGQHHTWMTRIARGWAISSKQAWVQCSTWLSSAVYAHWYMSLIVLKHKTDLNLISFFFIVTLFYWKHGRCS